MGNVSLEVSIPLDEDSFLEMECDFCKNRFMLHKDVFEDEDNLHFFCPICGLPNQINTFYCPEVLEKVEQKALNYMYDEIERKIGGSIRKINKSGLIKMSMKRPKREPEKELYKPAYDYNRVHQECCNIDVKVQDLDNEIGIYCPICGGTNL
ncbi:hypothetical protein acsn021_11700 [Anaerocolumna cellulosilytica]|uniref:Uncharacterized protein n=1 Tax=Anaerocolumna cellulosilytica TaxID=433286 RepID=A0A6S6R380_9FIRM|nr:hypothetical protein [Anaerocolumna cellulosilytica]MBB5196095.1 putative RNA-binding Zn-ribbon protein involved in translation (DUF1610 family) [Anaerocolumna cellulosilytica]BCJ93601.1 hypothetical protein acsn021_11700 [Anaerocolumna cellulosilytica]